MQETLLLKPLFIKRICTYLNRFNHFKPSYGWSSNILCHYIKCFSRYPLSSSARSIRGSETPCTMYIPSLYGEEKKGMMNASSRKLIAFIPPYFMSRCKFKDCKIISNDFANNVSWRWSNWINKDSLWPHGWTLRRTTFYSTHESRRFIRRIVISRWIFSLLKN